MVKRVVRACVPARRSAAQAAVSVAARSEMQTAGSFHFLYFNQKHLVAPVPEKTAYSKNDKLVVRK